MNIRSWIGGSTARFSALLSGSLFLIFRAGAEVLFRREGVVTTGMLQHDSFGFLAYAQELHRTGSWLFFRNPSGSLDEAPFLFNGLASLLRLLYPVWSQHLLLFDFVCGISLSIVCGTFFGKILEQISPQPRPRLLGLGALAILGGGLGFVLLSFKAGDPALEDLLRNASYWGLSWAMNQIATWELLYHAIFWWGVLEILRGRSARAVFAGTVLALTHPFNFISYALFSACAWFSAWRRAPETARKRLPIFLSMFSLACLHYAYFTILLPSISEDAGFLLRSYQHDYFVLSPTAIVLYFLPSACILLLTHKARSPEAEITEVQVNRRALILSALALIAMSQSYHFTRAIPQPAHWLRVYPIAFLLLAASTYSLAAAAVRRANRLLLGAVLLASLDTALGFRSLYRHLSSLLLPPAFLKPDAAALFERLREIPPSPIFYFRQCSMGPDFPSFEFALTALTPHRMPFGHQSQSPNLDRAADEFRACGQSFDPARLPAGSLLVMDREAEGVLPMEKLGIYGRYVLGQLAPTPPPAGNKAKAPKNAAPANPKERNHAPEPGPAGSIKSS